MTPNAGRAGLLNKLVDPFGYPIRDLVSRIKLYEASNNASTKSVTITDPEINSNMNIIGFCTSLKNDPYTDFTLSNGSCVITFANAALRTVGFYVYREG